LFRRNNWK